MAERFSEKRETLRFEATVGPGERGTMTFKVPKDCTIEKIMARFYSGQQKDLRVRPYVVHGGNINDGLKDELIQYVNPAVGYLSGDDDVFHDTINHYARKDELICVDYENINAQHSYDFIVHIEIDYQAGIERV